MVVAEEKKLALLQNNVSEREDILFHSRFQFIAANDDRALNFLVNKEMEYSAEVLGLIETRDEELENFEKATKTQRNFRSDQYEMHREEIMQNYGSQMDALKSLQRRQFKQLVHDVYEGKLKNDEFVKRQSVSKQGIFEASLLPVVVQRFGRELHRAQLKTMHNVRLTNVNPLYLERRQNSLMDASARLQTALFLYGNRLCGLLQVVSDDFNHHIKHKTGNNVKATTAAATARKSLELFHACERSAELHFADLQSQLDNVKRTATLAKEKRAKSPGRLAKEGYTLSEGALSPGNVYITRHSNLCSYHTIFHLVCGDDVSREDINSRHPCIHGLRNVVRLCHEFGVSSLAIPLLLVDDLDEWHTEAWCLRRAELVFKCVKGYMIECAKYASTPEYTIHFFLPYSVNPSLFRECAEMITSIFQTTKPLVA
ncbi:DUF2362 domain containing protein [Trichuris trichiura]|uniref:DUF2362 domain containing protein n=1 Tax=Trichuris trichiura TaxID=36087 RepID=A0A077YYN6_TRITR|nr:DUF2362 domain containing protein [Trichuris trichiura]